MTTRAAEQVKHELWMRRARLADRRPFEELLANEFCTPAELAAWQRTALATLVRFAVSATDYYAAVFAGLGLTAADIDGSSALPKLPLLHKHEVIASQRALCARQLPPGEQVATVTESAGTTGRPVQVYHSAASAQMFGLLACRAMRWFGFDPAATLVSVTIPTELPKPDGVLRVPDCALVQTPGWSYVAPYFHTGPHYAFSNANSIAQQLHWLRQIKPQYIKGFPSLFEEWLLASGGAAPLEGLQGLLGISAQMTPALRARIEQGYHIPVHQGYGLNEIGIVAGRCAAGRYHVHAEHCLVEIVDDNGDPSAPGQTGKIVVTGLRNFAMPLIRYDTGDLAVAVTGPCACGRGLPAFGEIEGRYRRFTGLPAGTRGRVQALIDVIAGARPEHLGFLRRYQIYQDRHNRFELRLVTIASIPDAFQATVVQAWASVAGTPAVPLVVREVTAIEPAPSGKALDFASEFHLDASVNPTVATAMSAEQDDESIV